MTPIRYAVDVVVASDDADVHSRVQKALAEIMEDFQGEEGILSTGMGITEAFTGEEVVEEAEEVEERRVNAATVTDPSVQEEFLAGFEEARDG